MLHPAHNKPRFPRTKCFPIPSTRNKSVTSFFSASAHLTPVASSLSPAHVRVFSEYSDIPNTTNPDFPEQNQPFSVDKRKSTLTSFLNSREFVGQAFQPECALTTNHLKLQACCLSPRHVGFALGYPNSADSKNRELQPENHTFPQRTYWFTPTQKSALTSNFYWYEGGQTFASCHKTGKSRYLGPSPQTPPQTDLAPRCYHPLRFRDMSHSVMVVPCFNEAQRLDVRRFERFAARSQGIDFLLVNDGSRDATLELLEGLHSRNPRRFSFLHLKDNSGKAEAVRQGCLLALEAQPDYVGYWDADLATPLEEIPNFAHVLQRKPAIEVVVGCRLPLLGHRIARRPMRRLLGRAFANVASLALGLPIYDTQCGAKLFRATSTLHQVLSQPFLTRWIFDVEILARMTQIRRQQTQSSLASALYEQPLDRWQDVAGSKLKRGDFAKAFFEMTRIYCRYLRPGADWHPAIETASPPDKRRAA